MRSLPALFLALIVVFLSGPAAAEDSLVWRGDQATGYAIMQDLAQLYAKDKKGHITLEPFSTVSGLDAVAKGTADIAGSARGKYDRRPEEAGINFVPVALDGAVMITHPRNPVKSLTLLQIHDIYYGRITNWKELGGEDRDIDLYAIAAPLDGVEFSVRDLVFHNGDQRVAAPRLYLNTTKLEEAIAIDPAGLGLSTYSRVHDNKGVKPLAVEGISASDSTIANGTYPLYITLYLAERVDSPKSAEIDRFIAFTNTPAAKAVLRKHALVPYDDVANANALAAARTEYIAAHLGGATGSGVVTAVASAPTPTPVSAPRATLESRVRIAPTAQTTQEARENLARAEAAKEKKAAEERAAREAAAAAAKKPAEKKEVVVASNVKEAEPAAKPAPKPKAAKARAKPKKKAAVAKAEPKKPKPPSFDNVDAAAKTKPAKPSFGDVSGGAGSANAEKKDN